MDRFWGQDGQPLLYEGERLIISADKVKIGGTSKGDSKLKSLNKGSLYVTNVRVIFISIVKKKADLISEKYDGLSIFYTDITNAERVGPGGRSLKIECQYKKHKLIKKTAARIYFKSIPSDIADEIINQHTKTLKDKIEETPSKKKEKPKKVKETYEEEPEEAEIPPDIRYMINELGQEEVELQCPKCGSLIKYKPGLKVCPICKKKVNFFSE
ncbi:MAG: hypothetical protein EU548_03915 [Promethearchaeota archaeon]|nr:MAG: hypothetical protein EU548_03915 [Candidatus Lokiarchaeota archaeon]